MIASAADPGPRRRNRPGREGQEIRYCRRSDGDGHPGADRGCPVRGATVIAFVGGRCPGSDHLHRVQPDTRTSLGLRLRHHIPDRPGLLRNADRRRTLSYRLHYWACHHSRLKVNPSSEAWRPASQSRGNAKRCSDRVFSTAPERTRRSCGGWSYGQRSAVETGSTHPRG